MVSERGGGTPGVLALSQGGWNVQWPTRENRTQEEILENVFFNCSEL